MRWTDFHRALTGCVLAVAVAGGAAGMARAQTSPGEDCVHGCGEPASPAPSAVERVIRGAGGQYENVVIGPTGEAATARALIEAEGGTIQRSRENAALDQVSQIATFPSNDAYERARAAIAAQTGSSALDRNHVYGFAQSGSQPRLYAPMLIGDGEPGRCRIDAPVTIGMIDGPVNADHPALSGAVVTVENVVSGTRVPPAHHGTAVAQLLVGEDATGSMAGFARGARLHAVSAFALRETGEEASVEHITLALDRLVGAGVRLINLSIAGPENRALARVLSRATQRGAVLIAASGNDRRPQVAWPAAAPEVIAVTAVDAARRRFSRANTGLAVEFAAPGVDVFAARAVGGGYVTGTSFAAPIVTALAARHMAAGARSTDAIRARLRAGVDPLGPGQRNTDFGWGLVQSGGC